MISTTVTSAAFACLLELLPIARGARHQRRPLAILILIHWAGRTIRGAVIPATLLALNEDMSIDERASRKHLRDCALVPGVSAVTVNGHASEVHACTFDEQTRILAISTAEVGDEVPIVNGVYADGSIEAAKIAAMSEREGASALLGGYALARGDEMGGFQLGSSIVMVFEAPTGEDDGSEADSSHQPGWKWNVQRGQKVKVGQALGWVEEADSAS